jgi:hypothetical protein
VDGNSRDFWLANAGTAESISERRGVVTGKVKGKDPEATPEATLRLLNNSVELGFAVILDDFEQRLDPGTSRPSGFSSRIDFVKKDKIENKEEYAYEEDVLVTLNRPASFTDPADGKTYRFFQTSRDGPFRPGDPEFDRIVGGKRKSDELYLSVFSVASDPGRQLKYAGCLMIVAGIAVMYYMKAYFFRRKKLVQS